MRIFLRMAAVAALVLAAPAVVHAQDADDDIVKQAKEHYRLGLEAFKAAKYTDAIKELKRAYLLKRLPPLLVNIAKTYEKLNDPDNAIYYYKKYLTEAPPDAKDRADVKQALVDIQKKKDAPEEASGAESLPEASVPSRKAKDEEEAPPPPKRKPAVEQPAEEEAPPPKKKRVEEAPAEEEAPPPKKKRVEEPVEEVAPTPPPKKKRVEEAPVEEVTPTPPPKKKRTEEAQPQGGGGSGQPADWSHVPIDTAPPGQPVDVRVQTPVMKGVKVFLYYREPGTADFRPLEMKRHGSEKIARIPGEAMSGKSIQYYIEAKDKTGAVVKNSGTQVDPNIVMIEAGAPPVIAKYSGGGSDEEQPIAEPTRPRTEETPAPRRRDPAPVRTTPVRTTPKAPAGPTFDTLGYVGFGLMGGGLVVGGVGGGLGLYFGGPSGYYTNLVFNDATSQDAAGNLNCRTQANAAGASGPYKGRCYFNDPVFGAGQTDSDYQTKGKTWGLIAPIAMGVGGAMIGTGLALVIYDYVKLHSAPAKKGPDKKNGRRPSGGFIPREDATRARPPAEATRPAPTEEAAPPVEEAPASAPRSSIQNLMILPAVTPTSVGLGAGFNF